MKTISVEIKGTSPLLMHSPAGMSKTPITKNPAKQYDPKVDAEKVAYRNKKGQLYIPARCMKACIINGASWYKSGKKAMKPLIAAAVRIEPSEILLGTKNYEIDIRPVVVQRARIMRARPKFEDWKVSFDLVYNDKIIADADLIHKILIEAGERIGLLDNRPQRYGECGCFTVTKFKKK